MQQTDLEVRGHGNIQCAKKPVQVPLCTYRLMFPGSHWTRYVPQMSNRQQQGNNHREWCRIVSTYYINRGNKKNEKTYQLQSHGVDIVDARGVWQEQMGKKRYSNLKELVKSNQKNVPGPLNTRSNHSNIQIPTQPSENKSQRTVPRHCWGPFGPVSQECCLLLHKHISLFARSIRSLFPPDAG